MKKIFLFLFLLISLKSNSQNESYQRIFSLTDNTINNCGELLGKTEYQLITMSKPYGFNCRDWKATVLTPNNLLDYCKIIKIGTYTEVSLMIFVSCKTNKSYMVIISPLSWMDFYTFNNYINSKYPLNENGSAMVTDENNKYTNTIIEILSQNYGAELMIYKIDSIASYKYILWK